MALLLNVCPLDLDICVTRGDTTPWTFTIKTGDPAVAVDITGFTFVLTVDPAEEPADALGNLFSLTGTITDGPNGVVEFSMTALQADQLPDIYFFDLQMTDGASALRTIAKGKYEFKQDISK